jgi:predicted ATPase/DNA-binding CsgD family transcriptional regulator
MTATSKNAEETIGSRTTRSIPNNLPITLSSFIGRERERDELRNLLGRSRLVTLIGAGGVGKTRLAIAAADAALDAYPHGVWFVELAPISRSDVLSKTVASVLQVQEQPGRPLHETLAEALRFQEVLLVLDNCEHLVQVCAELIDALLRACVHLRVLATSRQALRIEGEIIWRVPSLSLPGPELEDLMASEAARLFVERACSARVGFDVTPTNAPLIRELCVRLDGIPLAIELAAVRVPALGMEQLVKRLGDCLRLLTGGRATALPRQQTLRATLDWSHALLAQQEQILFRRLAVFAGGWTLDAAETVCAGADLATYDIADLLIQLVDKSLILADTAETDSVRYELLEPVRAYARENLQVAGEDLVLRDAHREWCLRLAEEAEPMLYGAEQLVWLERLEQEHDNLRSALASGERGQATAATRARIAAALGWFWYLRGHLADGARWLEKLATRESLHDATVRARVLQSAGWMAYGIGDLAHAESLFGDSLDIACRLGDLAIQSRALACVGFILRDKGEHVAARPLLEESLDLFRQIGDRWGEALSLHLLSTVARSVGDVKGGADLSSQSVSLFRELGDRFGIAYALQGLARSASGAGDDQRAIALFNEALDASRELINRRGICFSLVGLASIARRKLDWPRAFELYREALNLWYELGNADGAADALIGLGVVATASGDAERGVRLLGAATNLSDSQPSALPSAVKATDSHSQALASGRRMLGEAGFTSALAVGNAMSLADAIRYANDNWAPGARPLRSDHSAHPLTPRETEVVALIARGYSNREIAEHLVITTRTAETHVTNCMTKLGLHSRAQLAAWSVTHRDTT